MSFSSRRGRDHRPVRRSSTSPPDRECPSDEARRPLPSLVYRPALVFRPDREGARRRGQIKNAERLRLRNKRAAATLLAAFRRTSRSRCCATRSPRAGSPNCVARRRVRLRTDPRGNCPGPASVTPATAVPNPLRDQGRLSGCHRSPAHLKIRAISQSPTLHRPARSCSGMTNTFDLRTPRVRQ